MDGTGTYFDDKDKPVTLGEVVGRGGEGQVFALPNDPQQVAKVYDTPPVHLQRNKLSAMARLATPQLTAVAAWPTSTLREGPQRTVVGFIMPALHHYHPLHRLYSPAERDQLFPDRDWGFLVQAAAHLAEAFAVVHEHGHIIGDVNERNVLVGSDAQIALIDCDSFQVHDGEDIYLCDVGVDLFTPPELQNKDLRGVQRSTNHDMFGLAVLIFQMLFMGRHPYVGRYTGDDEMTPQRAITEARFAFSRTAGLLDMTAPPFALSLDELPPNLAMLFERSFLGKITSGNYRPFAQQWADELNQLAQHIGRCEVGPRHAYWRELDHCPWCRITGEGGPDFFEASHTDDTELPQGPQADEVEQLWRQIDELALPKHPAPSFSSSRTLSMSPRPLSSEVKRDMLWKHRATIGVAVSAGVFVVFGMIWLFDLLGYAGVLAILGGNALVIFAAIWAVIHINARPRTERQQRQQHYRNQTKQVNEFVAQWRLRVDEYEQQAAHFKQTASRLRDNYHALANTRSKQFAAIEATRHEIQLDEYLSRFTLEAQFELNLDATERALLRSYQIISAADVRQTKLDLLPGQHDDLANRLFNWRKQKEQGFSFDPEQPVEPAQITRISQRFATDAEQLLAELKQIHEQFETLIEDADLYFMKQRNVGHELWETYCQAKVDNEML